MPALRALLQDFVITFLVLFNQSFEAHVAAHFQSAMITGKKEEESGNPAVPVAEWMDAEEVEIERRGQYERMHPFLDQAALPKLDHFAHGFRGFFRCDRFEANSTAAIRVGLNDVHIFFFVLARVPDFAPAKA